LAALPRLSGASEYTPSCENFYSKWGDAADVPNVVATSSDNEAQKKYNCYGSQAARSRNTFDCASSVPMRQRLCYCDYAQRTSGSDASSMFAKSHEVFHGRPDIEKKDAARKTAEGAELVGSALAELDGTLQEMQDGKAAMAKQHAEAMGDLDKAEMKFKQEREAMERGYQVAMSKVQDAEGGVGAVLESEKLAVADILKHKSDSIEEANDEIERLGSIQKHATETAERTTSESEEKIRDGEARLTVGKYEAQDARKQ